MRRPSSVQMPISERLRLCLADESVRPPRLRQTAMVLFCDGRFDVVVDTVFHETTRKVWGSAVRGKGYRGERIRVWPAGAKRTDRNRLLCYSSTDQARTNRDLARDAAKILGW